MKWNPTQEMILMECARMGAEACRDLIFKHTGVRRSVEATRRHAYRVGVSLERYEICPVCGRPRRALNKTSGLCEVCHTEELTAAHKAEIDQLELIDEMIKNGEDKELENAKREYAKMRQAARRARVRYAQNVACEDSAKLSPQMSLRRSEEQKSFEEPPEQSEGSAF